MWFCCSAPRRNRTYNLVIKRLYQLHLANDVQTSGSTVESYSARSLTANSS
jgi:hypothetical protein